MECWNKETKLLCYSLFSSDPASLSKPEEEDACCQVLEEGGIP